MSGQLARKREAVANRQQDMPIRRHRCGCPKWPRGGPREGVAYQVERLRVYAGEALPAEPMFPLRLLCVPLMTSPMGLYFRVRRGKIPYVLGPTEQSARNQVWLPLSSVRLLIADVYRQSNAGNGNGSKHLQASRDAV